MARPLRICIPGGIYHVISRGNGRGRIVWDDADRKMFFRCFGQVVERFSWLCHAYCLMDNHYHLLIETPLPNLPSGMRQLNGLYAQRFNRRHERCGHVFASRYRSILVERESHLMELSRYIVLNPVRAEMCSDPAASHWSSYAATAGLAETPPFLSTDWLLAQFASRRHRAQQMYREYIAEAAEWIIDLRVTGERAGNGDFLRTTFGFDPPLEEIPRVQVEPVPPTLEEIFSQVQACPIVRAYRRHGYTIGQIAKHLGCSYSTVSRRLRREEAELAA
jgi:REP element-mobilizing transposase RayT